MANPDEKVATEIAKAIIQAGLEGLEMSFDDLCEEAGIDPSEVEELRHG